MIDCHAHLACEDFDPDRDEVCARAAAAGVRAVLVVGEDEAENRRVGRICRESGGALRLLPCFGYHPDRFRDDRALPSRQELDSVLAQIRSAAGELVAIGEVGLDHWYVKDGERREAQAAFLEEVAALAAELDLPLSVHSRSAGRATVDLLLGVGARRVLMHAFDGKASHAVRAAEAGYLFSIPPSAARSPQKQKLIRRLPLESLALETDSPVLAPEKGTRNEPRNVTVARDEIARLQGVSPEEVVAATTASARRLFSRSA